MILLGTGTSVGVPSIGCGCAVCRSESPKNKRTRSSAILGLPQGNLLIDTGPDMRTQLLREDIGLVHAVAYTHEHADHLLGLDDLRLMQHYLGRSLPLYCEPSVERRIRSTFDYAFSDKPSTHSGAAPKLHFETIGLEPFDALGVNITPIRLLHGPRFHVLGFRVGNVAYCTDTSEIPAESWSRLEGLDVLILDALRTAPHVTHMSLSQAVEASQRIGAKRVYFTHISHDLDHEATNAELPDGMELAYDGLRIPLT
jgi:phosphoribosyl 1,2-cyclic phosphate phosphodiesterase